MATALSLDTSFITTYRAQSNPQCVMYFNNEDRLCVPVPIGD